MSKALIENYLNELQARNQSTKSIRAYNQLLTDLERIAPLEEYTKENLIYYFNTLTKIKRGENGELIKTDIKPQESTVQLKKKMAQKFFRDQNKPEIVKWIKIKELPEKIKDTDILTDSEVNLLIETAHTHYSKALISFLYDTGARISEAMKLTYADLFLIEGNMIVNIPTTKTSAGYRKTALTYSDIYLRNLETYTERKKTDKIFCLSYSSNSRIIKETALEAGLEKKVTAHRFRHAHATELVRNGTQEAIIRKELGWSASSAMIKRYQHLNDDDVVKSKLEKSGRIVETKNLKEQIKEPEAVNVITTAKKIKNLEEEVESLRTEREEFKKGMELLNKFNKLLEDNKIKMDGMEIVKLGKVKK